MSAPFAGGSSQPPLGHWGGDQAYSQQQMAAHADASARQGGLDRRFPNDQAIGPTQSGHTPTNPTHYPSPSYNGLDHMRMNSTEDASDAGRRPSANRLCAKCGKPLSGQFVRALDATYHLECFTCQECGKIVASKFFPVPDEGPNQYPLCETDYFRRLDLICFACGNALRGSYITALDRKYHIEHFTCSVCPTVFGAQDSYYEHDGKVFCHYHYSTRFAQRCHGCHNAILKQFVEIFRNGQNQHWHPECYMIHKYWNVRLHNPDQANPAPRDIEGQEQNASEETRRAIRAEEERVEEKVLWIWKSLSAFEERAATCISDMLLHVSNLQYYEGIMAARKFIIHVELFFECTDDLDHRMQTETSKGLAYSREAKLLCKKVVAFFQLLSEAQTTDVGRKGVTQDLLALVTGLAHYLKLLIRICLQGALKLERDTGSSEGLRAFLEKINTLDERLTLSEVRDPLKETAPFVHRSSDSCPICEKPVEDKCARKGDRVFHLSCLICNRCGTDLKDNLANVGYSPSRREILCRNDSVQVPDVEGGFISVTKLQQYIHLLKVAHARLLATLQNSGAINVMTGTTDYGDRINKRESTAYEQTLGDIRRLRSTRMDKQVGNTMKRARSSRIIDGPGGVSARPGSQEGPEEHAQGQQNLQIVHDRNPDTEQEYMFGMQQMALDDIPRIVQAEVTKEIRPNAAKYAGNNLASSEPKAKFINGHRRSLSSANELDKFGPMSPRQRRYFGELTPLEYIIARTVAVLYLEPLLEGQFSHQELMELVETKRPTFWGRFNKAFKNDKGGGKKKGVFGRSLEQVVDRDGAESTDGVGPGPLRVPAIIENTVSAMRNMDMSVEGVFRKNGNMRKLKEQVELIDTQGCEAVDLTREQPVQVAVLLKKFLREMPEPLLTFKLYKVFITAAKMPDDERRQKVLHLTCCLLPKVNRDTMEILFTFLNWAASFHTVDEESGSKMDVHNLATVIAPNVLHGGPKAPDVEGSFLAVEIVRTMIEYNETMCEVPMEIVKILHDSDFDPNAEPSTKDIIKRFGDLVRQPTTSTSSPRQTHSHQFSQGRTGMVQHSDPASWPTEGAAARPMAGSGYGTPMMMNTPPQIHTPEQSGSPGPRQSQFRGNGFPGGPGPLGITGTG